jgi:hypothetical protein
VARACPQCHGVIPATRVMAFSDGIECPHCHARLEVASGGRMIAVIVGLAAAWLAWRLIRDSANILGFALSVLVPIVVFGAVSALVVTLTAVLRPAPVVPIAEPVSHADHAAPAHGGSHH